MSILDRAELLLQAKNYSGSGNWLDESGNSHDATPTNSPTFLAHDGAQYLWLPKTSGNYISTPDASVLDVTGDIDIRAKVASDDWSPTATDVLVARDDLTNRSFAFRLHNSAERLGFLWWESDGTLRSALSTVDHGFTDGSVHWVRVTLDVDNGSSQYEVKFYESDDGDSWTQIGSTTTGATGVSSVRNTAAPLSVGQRGDGSTLPFGGEVYVAEMYNGIDGTLVARMDASEAAEPFASWTGADDGLVWTINRGSSGYVSTVVDRDMWVLNGSNDHFVIADNAALDFAAGDSFTLFFAGRHQTFPTGSEQVYMDKRQGGTGASHPGYYLRAAYNFVAFEIADGSVETSLNNANEPDDGYNFVAASRRNTTADNLETYVDGVGTGSPGTDTTTGSLASTNDLYLTRYSWANTGYLPGNMYAVALFREALSDAEVALVSSLLINPDAADPSELHGDALWWWIQQYETRYSGSDTELVGELNTLNSTSDKEYAEARGTYLGVDPAG